MSEKEPGFSWGHFNINVSNLEQSIDFYELFGFAVFVPAIPYLDLSREGAPSPVPEDARCALDLPPGAAGRACIMQLGRGFPMLDLTEWVSENSSSPPTNADLGPVRICLATSNLKGEYERLTKAGVPFLSEPQRTKGEIAEIALCRDPDGTLIELIQIHVENWPRPTERD